MKFSQALIPTLRQPPADAEVASHKLLVRAGFIRKVTAGIYEYLPLGLRALQKVEGIVRDELNKTGCQEVLMPHMVPGELWQQSGRWDKYGPELLRIRDRHDRDYCFGPTHEEVICDLVRGEVTSYKAFPFHLYQIQTKFRDERRPRYGLMRGREFLMKDGYSFHTSFKDLDREYALLHQTYLRIFQRCGLECRSVEADTGSIGGSSSHEFMVLAETGEDTIAVCLSCDYAANLEKATCSVAGQLEPTVSEPMAVVETPNLKNIEEVSKFLKISPSHMIKSLVYKADDAYIMVCVAGDREVNEIKLSHVVDAKELRMASDAEIEQDLGLPVGFLGPLGEERQKFQAVFFDKSLQGLSDLATGANKSDYHTTHIDLARDLGQTEDQSLVDVTSVVKDDACPQCEGGKLNLIKGIEVGHIFKLGTRYSEPLKLHYLDQQGKENPVIMGTYGIGVSRVMAACVEQHHDEGGMCWPRALAPYEIHLMTLDADDDIMKFTAELYAKWQQHGVSVLWDERDVRAGIKFKDADLIGCPLQVVVGRRGFDQNQVEYKIRRKNQKGHVMTEQAFEELTQKLSELK